MKNIFLCFQIHQPFRLRYFPFHEIGQLHDDDYFDEVCNRKILKRIVESCYLPANKILLELIRKNGDRFKVAFSISGTALEQFEKYFPQVLSSFTALADTGNVEFLATSNGHSLSFQKSNGEFKNQALAQAEKIKSLFGQNPIAYRHVEPHHSLSLEKTVRELGFKVLLSEDPQRNPKVKSLENKILPDGSNLHILRKDQTLSDGIPSAFSDNRGNIGTHIAQNVIGYVNGLQNDDQIVNLFLDYENFGEHHKAEKGVFDFLKALPGEALGKKIGFLTPNQITLIPKTVNAKNSQDPDNVHQNYDDLTFLLGNHIQRDAFDKLYSLANKVVSCNDLKLQEEWLYLQASDHFFYMNTDKTVGSNYKSPHDAYINFMNILADFSMRLDQSIQADQKKSSEGIKQLDSAPY